MENIKNYLTTHKTSAIISVKVFSIAPIFYERGNKMYDEVVWLALLYDFYGQLLTDKQIDVMDMHHEEDLSLAEIGNQLGITRQGAFDTVKRAKKHLQEYEDKLGLVAKFLQKRQELGGIKDRLEAMTKETDISEIKSSIHALIKDIEENL